VEKLRTSNPFTYLGPLTKPELFFDRRKELEDAYVTCEQILNGSVGGILVVGGRGSGKTSFLDALSRVFAQKKIAWTKIDLDEGMVTPDNELTFIRTILSELLSASEKSGLLDQGLTRKLVGMLKGLKVEGDFELTVPGISFAAKVTPEETKQFSYIILRDGLKDYLDLIKEQGRKDTRQGAMLLFDEGDCLTLNRNLLQILRNVFQNIPRVGLVIAGSTRLLGQVSKVFSPLPRFFRKIELGSYPDDSVALEAISKPLEISKRMLSREGWDVDFIHRGFEKIVIRTTGLMPLEINLLCHFAFDLGAQIYRIEGKKITIYFKFNKQLLDIAIHQLVGTRGYSEFIGELNDDIMGCLRLLSKCTSGATLEEITLLLNLTRCGDSLQELPMSKVGALIREFESGIPKVSELINVIMQKGDKHGIYVLNSTLIGKPLYGVEDQWVRSYFKYGWKQEDVDIELGVKPKFGGIRVFGDPISSVIHSVFFPRVSEHIVSKFSRPSFRAHVGTNDGRWLRPQTNRQLLIASYVREANASIGHYAVNLEMSYEAGLLKREIDEVLHNLKETGFIEAPQVIIKKSG
jgi:hypothetical protein